MRFVLAMLLGGSVFLAGCAGKKGGSATVAKPGQVGTAAAAPPEQKLIVTPSDSRTGKVVKLNPVGRFVVLNFPVDQVPAPEQVMAVYRRGLKVGEVRITGPQLDDNIVADLIAGEANAGDEVREK